MNSVDNTHGDAPGDVPARVEEGRGSRGPTDRRPGGCWATISIIIIIILIITTLIK